MTTKFSIFIIACLTIGILVANGLIFTVDQTKQALVLQFGELRKAHTTPGLKFKIPFIQEVVFYEKRVLDYDLPPIRLTTGDQKRLEVSTYTRYRIKDPLLFFKSIKPANEIGARMRLDAFVSSALRNVLGRVPLRNLLSEERSKIMKQIESDVQKQVNPLGIEIIDVRIIRTELPNENREAVFKRMNSELIRIATENRAKGAEGAQEIRAHAEKDRTILLAESQKKAQTLRGIGEAEAIKIAGAAFGKDPDFYAFYRSMEAYKDSLDSSNTTLLISPDNDFFRFFSHPNGAAN